MASLHLLSFLSFLCYALPATCRPKGLDQLQVKPDPDFTNHFFSQYRTAKVESRLLDVSQCLEDRGRSNIKRKKTLSASVYKCPRKALGASGTLLTN